jgi:hypothetical protein
LKASTDAHRRAGRPPIKAALAIERLNMDFDGVIRPQGVAGDLGAFEFRSDAKNMSQTR